MSDSVRGLGAPVLPAAGDLGGAGAPGVGAPLCERFAGGGAAAELRALAAAGDGDAGALLAGAAAALERAGGADCARCAVLAGAVGALWALLERRRAEFASALEALRASMRRLVPADAERRLADAERGAARARAEIGRAHV
jgi:hypothetical protein